MRIDHARILAAIKTYEKTIVRNNRKQADDDTRLPAVRDEVIISTEAKRQQIRDQVLGRVVERLKTLPNMNALPADVDSVREGVTDDGTPSFDPQEMVRSPGRGLDDHRREKTSW